MLLKFRNKYYRYRWFRLASRVFYTAAIPVLFVWVCVFNGGRVTGAQNMKGLKSAVTICNHVHTMDSALVAVAFYPRKLVFPTMPEKVDYLFPGIFMSLLGCISVPRARNETNSFFEELETFLTEGRVVHFFPEGFISHYGSELQEFKRGAFHLAARAHVPILPITISFHKPCGFYRLLRRKPVMYLTIGEPMRPASEDTREDEQIRMKSAYEQMVWMLQNDGQGGGSRAV